MKAILKNYDQSPRKVRLVADRIRGKGVKEALATLQSIDKKVSEPMMKLINSAVNNAQQKGEDVSAMKISELRVDAGLVLMRRRVRAGIKRNPGRLRRRRSTVSVKLQ